MYDKYFRRLQVPIWRDIKVADHKKVYKPVWKVIQVRVPKTIQVPVWNKKFIPEWVKEGVPGEKYLGKDEHGWEYTSHDLWRKKLIWKPIWVKSYKTEHKEEWVDQKKLEWKEEWVKIWRWEKKQEWAIQKKEEWVCND